MCSRKVKDKCVAADGEAGTSGVMSTASGGAGACCQCTCAAGEVTESNLFSCQGAGQRLTGGSDE